MKLKFGMVGGGNGAFIGNVHRHGALMDDLAILSAGCFTRDMEKNLETAKAWGLSDESRIYSSYQEMAKAESEREDGIDFVIIATPNDTHFEMAKCFLEHGIHIMCDKPLCIEVSEGEELAAIAKEKDLLFGVTFTYSAYAMIKQARLMIEDGVIGNIMTVMGEYPQEWMLVQTVSEHSEQATWRMDPSRSGPSGCCADIGTHVECLISQMTGLTLESVLASFQCLPEDASLPLENNVQVLTRYKGGATGMMWMSQVATGHECDIGVRVYGDKGSIIWNHRNPETLVVTKINEPPQLYTAARDYDKQATRDISRLPSGHPEGYYEAFGNMYRGFCAHLLSQKYGEDHGSYSYPMIEDGIKGIKFVDACMQSNAKGNIWIDIE